MYSIVAAMMSSKFQEEISPNSFILAPERLAYILLSLVLTLILICSGQFVGQMITTVIVHCFS